MNIGLIGGGNFYAPFTQTAFYQVTCVTPGIGGFSPWALVVDPVPFKGRWMDVRLFSTVAPGNPVAVQLGLGPAGAEAGWQPTFSGGGVPAFLLTAQSTPFAGGIGLTYLDSAPFSFPINLDINQRLSARGITFLAGADAPIVYIVIWG